MQISKILCVTVLFAHGVGFPGSGYRSGSLAFILVHEFSSLGSVALENSRLTTTLVPFGTAACYTPRLVSLSDKPRNDRLLITRRASSIPALFVNISILLPTAC